LQTRIYGDINIARYLTRTFLPDLYDETDVCAVTQIDHWLEYSRQIKSQTKLSHCDKKVINNKRNPLNYLVIRNQDGSQ